MHLVGTALFLADSINSACENTYDYVFDRHSMKKSRSNHEIGFSSIRGGSIVGEHIILFLGENESIEIKHTSYSRTVYAEGSIRATKFIVHQKNGLFGMEDLLNNNPRIKSVDCYNNYLFDASSTG